MNKNNYTPQTIDTKDGAHHHKPHFTLPMGKRNIVEIKDISKRENYACFVGISNKL